MSDGSEAKHWVYAFISTCNCDASAQALKLKSPLRVLVFAFNEAMPAKAKNKAKKNTRTHKKPAAASDDMSSEGASDSVPNQLKQRHPVVQPLQNPRALEDAKAEENGGSNTPLHTYLEMSIYLHVQCFDIWYCLQRHGLICICHPQYANHNDNV